MGYSAHYTGEFTFSADIGQVGIRLLNRLLQSRADLREREWVQYFADLGVIPAEDQYFIHLNFNDDFTALKPSGSEGSIYYASMVDAVELITSILRTAHPGIKLQGSMEAVGEDGERWKIVIDEAGIAKEVRGKVVYDE